ncbi:HTH domain-containing protein [Novipirellula rosea]|uniref:Helix-turn-helix type 11 domain-containing protein n=1 Tax=Novipirellula rosea TaxID=1031540 RepID=A0ABP8M8T8_9BACT
MTHYKRAIEIQQRLDAILQLIAGGQHSTPQIADEIGVSTATVSRCIEALRNQGNIIKAEKLENQWRYKLLSNSVKQSSTFEKAGKS